MKTASYHSSARFYLVKLLKFLSQAFFQHKRPVILFLPLLPTQTFINLAPEYGGKEEIYKHHLK
jgi:hypothetical protein